jgi:hypothetical protein
MCGSKSCTFSLLVVYHLPQNTRENMGFKEPHVLFLSRTISHKTGKEHVVLKTSCSLPVACHLL